MILPLIKSELIKLYNSKATIVISIIYVLFLLIVLSFTGFAFNLVTEKDGVEEIAYGGTILFLSIMPMANAILNTCSEFSSNMMKQSIINGMTRNQFILSKCVSNFILSVFYTLLFMLFSLLMSREMIQFSFHYMFSLFFVFNIASTFAFVFKKAGVAIAIFYAYYLFGEFLIYSRVMSIFGIQIDSLVGVNMLTACTTKANILLFIPGKQLTGLVACGIIIILMLGIQSLTIRNRSL